MKILIATLLSFSALKRLYLTRRHYKHPANGNVKLYSIIIIIKKRTTKNKKVALNYIQKTWRSLKKRETEKGTLSWLFALKFIQSSSAMCKRCKTCWHKNLVFFFCYFRMAQKIDVQTLICGGVDIVEPFFFLMSPC